MHTHLVNLACRCENDNMANNIEKLKGVMQTQYDDVKQQLGIDYVLADSEESE